MLPAGYLFKRIAAPPHWLVDVPSHIKDVCSAADCVNDNVIDVQGAWKHNGFGLANSPADLHALCDRLATDCSKASLLYFTAYEREMESDGWSFDAKWWRDRTPARSAAVTDDVEIPAASVRTVLLGYDVVVFGDYLEHSPLSCNGIAKEVSVNEHCLFADLACAIEAIERGVFGGGCENGLYTVFGVHLMPETLTLCEN